MDTQQPAKSASQPLSEEQMVGRVSQSIFSSLTLELSDKADSIGGSSNGVLQAAEITAPSLILANNESRLSPSSGSQCATEV